MNSGKKDEAGRRLSRGAFGVDFLLLAAAMAAFFSESCLAWSALTCLFFFPKRNRSKPRTNPIARMIPTAKPALPAVDRPESADELAEVVEEDDDADDVAALGELVLVEYETDRVLLALLREVEAGIELESEARICEKMLDAEDDALVVIAAASVGAREGAELAVVAATWDDESEVKAALDVDPLSPAVVYPPITPEKSGVAVTYVTENTCPSIVV